MDMLCHARIYAPHSPWSSDSQSWLKKHGVIIPADIPDEVLDTGKEDIQIFFPCNEKEPEFQYKHLHSHPQGLSPSIPDLECQADMSLGLDKLV